MVGSSWPCRGDATRVVCSLLLPLLTFSQVYRTATGGDGCLWSGLVSFFSFLFLFFVAFWSGINIRGSVQLEIS